MAIFLADRLFKMVKAANSAKTSNDDGQKTEATPSGCFHSSITFIFPYMKRYDFLGLFLC